MKQRGQQVKIVAEENAALPEGLELGGYRIVKKIAVGGFSIVYLAEDVSGRQVAIKEYLPAAIATRKPGQFAPVIDAPNLELYRLGMKCFFDEGRALTAIVHPNVVRVLNFFRAHNTVYMVMGYEQGRSLQEHLNRRRQQQKRPLVSERTIRSVFLQVMDALREVHMRKLLHLDLKPANIYLRDDGTPILLDFGAARQTLQSGQAQLHPIYTPGFAAPELHARGELGPWTDIYSIGASIFCCMLGVPPPSASERQQTDTLSTTIEPIQSMYSEALVGLVQRSLAIDPLARPQSIYALQKLLQLAQDKGADDHSSNSSTDTSSPPSLLSRLWRSWQ